jgi:hypothetical protein
VTQQTPQAFPRISIVTPSYNQGGFLDQCIRSVLDQQYPNLEYFIIDGGSTDKTHSIIRSHRRHLTYWVSEPDNGQSHAINKGFRRATGAVVAWLNSDDYYLPGALLAVAAAYQRQPRASFYLGNGLSVDIAGQPLGSYFPEERVLFHRPALVWGLNYVLQPATFINRAHLVRAGYLDESLKYGMDSDLWLKLSALAEPECLQVALAASREYGATKTSTGSFARVEELRQIAAQHSGLPVTPGSLCYLLDTLHGLASQRPDVFGHSFTAELEIFWKSVQRLFADFGARPNGFPLPPAADPAAYAEEPVGLSVRLAASEKDRAARLEIIHTLTAQLHDARQCLRSSMAMRSLASLKRLAGRALRLLGARKKAGYCLGPKQVPMREVRT